MSRLHTPVVLIVFNRPALTRRVFDAIATARPSHLLIIADGPRDARPGEKQLCDEVRKIVSSVDWPCKVDTNFSERNLGCRRRVKSGLDWVFSLVEEAIILEDDCLPNPAFFLYCTNLLERYRDCSQIGIIGGFNPLQESFPYPYSYYFTRLVLIWGWATWRRTWQLYDEQLSAWPEIKKGSLLRLMWKKQRALKQWVGIFDNYHAGVGADSWDYQLIYSLWTQNLLNIVPRCNLIENIGFSADATHTKKADEGFKIKAESLSFPLVHPPAIMDWPDYANKYQDRFYTPSLWGRIFRKGSFLLKRAMFIRNREMT
jgi:hypothetical protein